jgi:hypothetical protein
VEHNEEGKFAAWTWKQVTGLFGLLSVLPVTFALNAQYVGWHDARYAMKNEVLMLAEAGQIQAQVAITAQAQKANADKLDFLVKAEAAKTVIAIRQEIALHKASNDGSQLWHRELADMESRLQRAENYKQCVISGMTNCDAERIW